MALCAKVLLEWILELLVRSKEARLGNLASRVEGFVCLEFAEMPTANPF